MNDVIGVIREAILGTCGLGGVLKFNALFGGSFETEGGKPDLQAVGKAINSMVPPEQAATIMTAVTGKLGGTYQAPGPATQSAQEAKPSARAAGSPESIGLDGSAFAAYFNSDPNYVRDIVGEARRMRLAMGKPIAVPPGLLTEAPENKIATAGRAVAEPAAEKKTEKAVEIIRTAPGKTATDGQVVTKLIKKPDAAAMIKPRAPGEPVPDIDREIEQFAYRQTAYTSIDMIDFIRYMKDKGYSFDECIVLEKIYVRIEERKKEARSTIEKEVEGIFNGARAPAEPDISRLIGRLRENGLVFEEEDVRQLARVTALRRAQESL